MTRSRGIGGTASNGSLSYAAPIRMSFWDPGNSATLGVTNFVQIRGDLIPIAGTITMRIFDPLGALLLAGASRCRRCRWRTKAATLSWWRG